jgi:hypothetical protein
MWHTSAYSASITNSLTNTQVNALTDNVFRIGASNGFVMQQDMTLLWALIAPNNSTAARLLSPKLAQYGYLQLTPLQAAAKTANGLLLASWPYRPFTFRNQEEVLAYVDTGGSSAAQETIVCSWSASVDPIPMGDILTIKYTSTTAAVAYSWTAITITLSQTLPEGAYALIGSELQSTNAIAHRYTFWNQFYRPGWPSTTAYTNIKYPGVTDYRMGLAGQFSNVTLPTVEVLANTTDNSHTGYIHCIKVA